MDPGFITPDADPWKNTPNSSETFRVQKPIISYQESWGTQWSRYTSCYSTTNPCRHRESRVHQGENYKPQNREGYPEDWTFFHNPGCNKEPPFRCDLELTGDSPPDCWTTRTWLFNERKVENNREKRGNIWIKCSRKKATRSAARSPMPKPQSSIFGPKINIHRYERIMLALQANLLQESI